MLLVITLLSTTEWEYKLTGLFYDTARRQASLLWWDGPNNLDPQASSTSRQLLVFWMPKPWPRKIWRASVWRTCRRSPTCRWEWTSLSALNYPSTSTRPSARKISFRPRDWRTSKWSQKSWLMGWQKNWIGFLIVTVISSFYCRTMELNQQMLTKNAGL